MTYPVSRYVPLLVLTLVRRGATVRLPVAIAAAVSADVLDSVLEPPPRAA